MCKGRLAAAWPPLFVVVIVMFLYSVFMLYNMVPQYERATASSPPADDSNDPNNYTPSKPEIYIVLGSFHYLFFMLWLCFFRSMLTPPGSIPNTSYWRDGLFNIPEHKEEKLMHIISEPSYTGEKLEKEASFIKSMVVVERKLKNRGTKKGGLRKCSTCNVYKPDRTHHCRICNQCVLRMDHHCPWIANCVGFNNYKYFMLLLLYAWTAALMILVFGLRRFIRAFRPVLDMNVFVSQDTPVIVGYIMTLFLFMALFVFFLFHMSLAFGSLTTIELREKRNSDSKGVQHRWAVAHVKFDKGSRYANFTHIFGSPWMWLFPIASDRAGTDGTYSEVEEFEETV